MAKMTVSGMKEVEAMLETIGSSAEDIAKRGLYEGAGVVADAVKESASKIPVTKRYGFQKNAKRGLTQEERDGLVESLGISTMETSGGKTTVSVGFDGYNGHATKRWPNGAPNAMVARSVERGTSFLQAHPFVKPTVQAYRSKAKAAIDRRVKEEIKKYTK